MIFALGPVVRKEFRQIRRDPLTLAMLLLVPVFLLAVFGYAISMDIDSVSLAVQDEDRSPQSRSFLASMEASGTFECHYRTETAAENNRLLLGGKVDAALVIPKGFGTGVYQGTPPSLQFNVDGSNATAAATVSAYMEAAFQAWMSANVQSASSSKASTSGAAGFISIRSRVWFNPELKSSLFLVPGLISFIMVITGVISTAMSVVREKERGTMEQLGVAPLAPAALILGKTIPYGLISLVETALILGAGRLFFDVAVRGSYLHLLLASILFILGCLGLGLMISTIAGTQQVAFLLSVTLTILPAFILSGFVFPIANMPLPVRLVTYLFPGRYYLSALRGIIIRGAGIASFWKSLAAMGIFAVVTLSISTIRLSRGYQS